MPLILANIFQPLIDIFDAVIRFFHDTVGLGWGLSIIALTVVVRTALIPLTVKQSKSMAAMQRLAPQIKELQAKYKDDKQRLNQEMMKFYQENKVNPFGSCLPLLLQMPVFLSLFYMLRKDLKLDICGDALRAKGITGGHELLTTGCEKVAAGSAKFLFIDDLTAKATGAVLITLIVLYIASQMGSSLLMSASADRNQRLMFLVLPLIFVSFIVNFPAGLIVYWITTNIWTVGQQYLIRRYITHHPDKVATPAGAVALTRAQSAPRAAQSRSTGDGRARADGQADDRSAPPPPPRKKKKRSGRRR
jgi:YidC/Oxa1 family membrane protein insertase